MLDIASGAAAPAVGLVGTDGPPLTPEPVGPAPSNFEAPPVPLRSFETILAERSAAIAVAAVETRRLVVRLLGGEELELGSYDDREVAVAAARELVERFSAAEASGEWPEVEGRFLRPGAVASIDVLVSA
jgi:hypothetical protein